MRRTPYVLAGLALSSAAIAAAAASPTVTVDGGRYPSRLDSRHDVACGAHRFRIDLTSRQGQPSHLHVRDGRGRPAPARSLAGAERFLQGIENPYVTSILCNARTVDIQLVGVSTGGGDNTFRLSLPLPIRRSARRSGRRRPGRPPAPLPVTLNSFQGPSRGRTRSGRWLL